MKTLKNDTRYIIKRVLIGVLIAILLFNARKCGVYAETRDLYNYRLSRSLYRTYLSNSQLSSVYVSGSTVNLSSSLLNTNETLTFNNIDYNLHLGSEGSSSSMRYYYSLYKSSDYNDTYLLIIFSSSNSTNINALDNGGSLRVYDSGNNGMGIVRIYNSNNEYVTTLSSVNFNILSTNSSLLQTISNSYNSFNSLSDLQPTSPYDSSIYGITAQPFGTDFSQFLSSYGFELTAKNVNYYLGDIEQEISNFPPSGYSELSLKDYQGVVFVPKNYNDIQCSVVGDLCNTTFDYYYQEEIKEAYFPLDNRFNIRFNSDFLNSPGQPSELKSTYFPISQVSVNETFYYAFMIYNYTNDGSPLDPNNYYAYGDAKIWYDSTLWNYYLVEDFNEWSANVCYMLDGNEVCTTISGLPTLKYAIEQAQLEQNILGTHVGDLNLFSSLIRFPLSFVQSLSSDSCTAIQLPSLPFIGGNITLPCMSLIYQQVLGIYQPVISGFINFIIIYYLILAIIKFYNRTFDPSRPEIEVIDL